MERNGKETSVWVPKSICTHVSRDPWDLEGVRKVIVTVEDWWIDKVTSV